jgi:hypothetical protein
MVIARVSDDDSGAGIKALAASLQPIEPNQLNFSSLVIHAIQIQNKEENCTEIEEAIIDVGSA